MKQLNFRHFNTNSKKFFETVNFFQKEAKTAPKRPILLFRISRRFRPFYDNSGFLQKISEGYWRFLKTVEDFRRLTKRSDYCRRCSKMTLLFSSETANTKKLANLTANTKNYGQITLNTELHSMIWYTDYISSGLDIKIYTLRSSGNHQYWFNTKATIVFCVVFFINLCSFSNIIDTVFWYF